MPPSIIQPDIKPKKCTVRRFTEVKQQNKKMVILMQYIGPDFSEHISKLAKHFQIFVKIQEEI